MDRRSLERRLEDAEARLAALEAELGNLPVRPAQDSHGAPGRATYFKVQGNSMTDNPGAVTSLQELYITNCHEVSDFGGGTELSDADTTVYWYWLEDSLRDANAMPAAGDVLPCMENKNGQMVALMGPWADFQLGDGLVWDAGNDNVKVDLLPAGGLSFTGGQLHLT